MRVHPVNKFNFTGQSDILTPRKQLLLSLHVAVGLVYAGIVIC